MKIQQTGFILYTIKYNDCIDFYENVLGLKVMYQKEMLTCFDFHGSYLMIELDDETEDVEIFVPNRDRTCIIPFVV